MIVMESLGQALAVEPHLATVVLSGGVICCATRPAPNSAPIFVPKIAGGEAIFAFAHHERQARYNSPSHVETTATKDGDGWVLDGESRWC